MFGSGAGFVRDRGRNVDGPLNRTSAPQISQDQHGLLVQELSQRSTHSGFSFDADSARSLADFDESDLEDSSYTSASNFAVVRRQAANPAPSMLLVSMLEHLCSLYETDQEKRNKLFKVICEHLTKMKIVSGVSWLDEFGSVREQYKKAFSNLVSAAVESVRTVQADAVVPLSRPTTTADRIKLLFQDSPVFSARPGPPQDAFQTFASRYANEFLELDRLGKGGFGRVFKVKNKLDGQEYAVKKIFLKESKMDVFFRIVREVKLLASLQHANVVRYHTAWMECSNPAMTSNRSSSTSLPVLETSYLQDIQNLRSPYLYADSNSIVFQESAVSDTEATVLKRRSLSKESSSYDVSVESYLQDEGKWQLGSSDSDDSLPGVQDKEDEPCLVDTENRTPVEDIIRHVSEKELVDNNEKSLKPFSTKEWKNPLEKLAPNLGKESEQRSDVLPTSEGGAFGKSQPDFEKPIRKEFQMSACYHENSLSVGTGFEQEVRFESASFSSSSSVRLGHSLPGSVVPFTSTPKDYQDVHVRGSFTGLSSVHSEKDNVPCLVDTENRATVEEINRHVEDVQQLYNERNKESPVDTVELESDKRSEKTSELLDTIPWETAGKEEADLKSEKDSTLLDTIPWESSRKEDKKSSQKTSRLQDTIPWETHRKDGTDDDNNSEKASTLLDTIPWETTRKENNSQKTSKRLDTIPWESDRKEGTKENRLSERATELQDTIPWETPRNEGSNNDFEEVFQLEDTIQWETPERGKEESEKIDQTLEILANAKQKSCASERELVDNNEKSSEPFNTGECEENGRQAQSAIKEGEQRSYVVPPVELKASSKSQTDCEQPVTKIDFQLAACYSENSVRVGTGFEQEMRFKSSSFSSSSSVRLGHSLPGAVVPFTSTPKDSVDVHVRGGFTPLSSLKRQHSWNQGARNGHTETHVCGDRCKVRLKGLADCELVAETSGVVLYIQMQLCQRSLRDWLVSRNAQAALLHDPFGGVSEDDNMRLFQQILQGVNYIHSQGLMHRDLKPPNIFLMGEDDHVCIGDFGLAREDLRDTHGSSPPLTPLEMPDVMAGETTHTSGVGTCTYASPEQLKGTTYNSKSDMYSMGVILFELFHPFGTEMERAKSIQDFREGRVLPQVLVERWPRQCDFMQLLTSDDPKYRPSAKDILKSDLFQDNDKVIANLKAMVDKQSREMAELRRQLKEREDMLLQLRRDRSTH